jgi:hypothetical protein
VDAQSAARFARASRMFRAVSRSGPCDNQSGNGNEGGQDYDPQNPRFDPDCSDEDISAWLDEPSKTPVERLFGSPAKKTVSTATSCSAWRTWGSR